MDQENVALVKGMTSRDLNQRSEKSMGVKRDGKRQEAPQLYVFRIRGPYMRYDMVYEDVVGTIHRVEPTRHLVDAGDVFLDYPDLSATDRRFAQKEVNKLLTMEEIRQVTSILDKFIVFNYGWTPVNFPCEWTFLYEACLRETDPRCGMTDEEAFMPPNTDISFSMISRVDASFYENPKCEYEEAEAHPFCYHDDLAYLIHSLFLAAGRDMPLNIEELDNVLWDRYLRPGYLFCEKKASLFLQRRASRMLRACPCHSPVASSGIGHGVEGVG